MPQQIGFRAQVRKRAKGKCECCGKRISKRINAETQGTIHHRFPRRNGLDNRPENLLLLHLKCHRIVHEDEDYAAMRGFIAHSEPGDTPVLLARERWVLLTSSGYLEVPAREAEALLAAVQALRGNRHVGVA